MNVLVDALLPSSDEAIALCQELNEPFADAIPMRLWAWALLTEKQTGLLPRNSRVIAAAVRWVESGANSADKLVAALISTGFLREVTEDGADYWYMCGWDRNAKYFKERNRLREKNRKKRQVAETQNQENAAGYSRVKPWSSSSSSSSSSKEQIHTADEDDGSGHPSRKVIGRTFADHAAAEDWKQRQRALGLPAIELAVPETASLRRILVAQGQAHRANSAVTIGAVFDEWLRDEWFHLYGRSLKMLERNIREVIAAVVDSKHRPKLKGQDGPTRPFRQEQTRHVIDGVTKLNAELEANPQRISADSPVRALVMRISNNPHDHEAKAALEQFMKEQEAQHVAT